MKKLFLFHILFLSLIFANESYWKGTIGENTIYLKLNCHTENSQQSKKNCNFSRYFYQSHLQDIVIEHGIEQPKNHYKLEVIHNDKIVELFILDKTSNMLKGFWESKGKHLKVILKRINLNNGYDTFEKLKIKFLSFKRIKVEKISDSKEFVWIEELHSHTKFFRLGNGFNKKSREIINPILDKLQNKFSIAVLGCSSAWDYGSEIENNIHSKLNYLSANLIGFEVFISGFCEGEAHPDFETTRYLFDLYSGKRYKLKNILTIADKPALIRNLAFQANRLPLKPLSKKDFQNKGYDPYDIKHWKSIGWKYTSKGIVFYLHFYTANRCYRGDSLFVPFSMLKPYKNKSFPYVFGKKH